MSGDYALQREQLPRLHALLGRMLGTLHTLARWAELKATWERGPSG